ncbi:redoxin domain-containing protein [Micromonospora sp. CPCC 206061]|uniref:redoxin domain-containing protein n=1 Tax=Micromonospora sp. CPCC 206061 TaxID=3122410 RepID=UPI002FF01AEF
MSRIGSGVGIVAVALVLAGCGADAPPASSSTANTSTAATTPSPSPSPASTTSGAAPDAPQILRFTATTVDGAQFDAATLAGKPAVLWFWAAWCPRCRAAADDVAGIQRDFAGKVTVVGVAGLNSGDAAMREFVADRSIGGFVNLADDKGEIWRRFDVTTQEYYVILDRSGTVVHKGPLSPDALRDRVTALAG